jgi:hypothetical protein
MILTATPESNEIKIGPGKMSVDLTSREISRKYDRFARWYDWVQGIPDLLGLSRLRRKLFLFDFVPSRKLESFCRSDDYASWRNCERKFFAVAYEKTASLIVCHFWHPNILVRPFEDCVRANLPPIARVIIICHQNSSGIHIAVSGARKETPTWKR